VIDPTQGLDDARGTGSATAGTVAPLSTQIGDVTPTMSPPGPPNLEEFDIALSIDDAGRATLRVVGPLDLVTEEGFQTELDRVVAGGARELVVDLTAAPFVSVRGYALIGLAGEEMDRLIVRTASVLSARVLGALGFDRVRVAEVSPRTSSPPAVDAPAS
jgi:anti-anti-sigma regulatory factor